MPKDQPPAWPKTADGTTDWEVVFEAEGTGFVAMVSQARSVDALSDCASVVVHSLKNDRPEVARYMALLTPAIDEGHRTGDIEETRTKVIRMLRQIKRDRVIKARQYVEQKNSKQALERRGSGTSLLTLKRLAIAAGIVVVMIGAGIGLSMMTGSNATKHGATADPDTAVAQQDAAAEPAPAEPKEPVEPKQPEKTAATPKPPAKPAAPPPPQYPRAVVLKPFFWPFKTDAGRSQAVSYQPFLEVTGGEFYSTICVNKPWITDALLVRLNGGLPKNRPATQAELDRIGSAAMRKINERYGAGMVTSIVFVPSTAKRFQRLITGCELEPQPPVRQSALTR
ncbi:MAG: hypothetical protein VW405_18725 [Rhodospirillaceae bacterium]